MHKEPFISIVYENEKAKLMKFVFISSSIIPILRSPFVNTYLAMISLFFLLIYSNYPSDANKIHLLSLSVKQLLMEECMFSNTK